MSDPISPVTVVASYDGSYEDVGFTLSAFSFVKAQWAIEPDKSAFSTTVSNHYFSTITIPTFLPSQLEGAFTAKTAGGNSSYPTFMNNPQYRLQVHPPPLAQRTAQVGKNSAKVSLRLVLEGARDIPLNAMLVWHGGSERVFECAATLPPHLLLLMHSTALSRTMYSQHPAHIAMVWRMP